MSEQPKPRRNGWSPAALRPGHRPPLVTLRSSLRMLPTRRNQPTPDDRRSPTVSPPCDQAALQEAANVRACPPYLDCASPLGSCPRGGDHRGRASPDSQGGTGDTTSCSASSSTAVPLAGSFAHEEP